MDLNNKLFIDIETHRVNNWNEIDSDIQGAFIDYYYKDKSSPVDEVFNEVSGLHAEFSHVICVCLGYSKNDEFRSIKLVDLNERDLLSHLSLILDKFSEQGFALAGYNIKGFDIPYLCKRYIINGMRIPKILNSVGKKPWEVDHLDVMELYKMGGWTNTSLKVACAAMGIKCKSTELKGENMYLYDIKDIDLEELGEYCLEDIVSTFQLASRIILSL